MYRRLLHAFQGPTLFESFILDNLQAQLATPGCCLCSQKAGGVIISTIRHPIHPSSLFPMRRWIRTASSLSLHTGIEIRDEQIQRTKLTIPASPYQTIQ
jgi:hypothetical protein